jgi:putative sugar O-methyltransferase
MTNPTHPPAAHPSAQRIADATSAMFDELDGADALYRPSVYWREVGQQNVAMLSEHGLENFKRTVAQNYFNWMIGRKALQRMLALWPRHRSLQPFFNRITRPEFVHTTLSRTNLVSARQLFIYKLYVGLLWEYMRSQAPDGLAERLAEPEYGNPIAVRRKGRLISQDLANSILEYDFIAAHAGAAPAGERIAELGAGYGRVAHVFATARPGCYCIFDIPPTLFVSQSYLSKLFPDARIFPFRRFSAFTEIADELAGCQLAFFTSNQMALFPDGWFHGVLSISTLPEMSMAHIRHYLAQFQRLASRWVYLKQWADWFNPLDKVRVTTADYALGDAWTPVASTTDPVQPEFFQCLWRRRG